MINVNLTPEQWAEFKVKFEAWQEIQSRKKELSEENKAICKDAAAILDAKTTMAQKIFKDMQKKWNGEEPESYEVSSVLEQLEVNGNS